MNRRSFVLAGIGLIVAGKVQAQPATPGVSEVEIAPGVQLLSPRYAQTSIGGEPIFLAEIFNTSGQDIVTPVLGLTFFDDDGNIVGSDNISPAIPVSPAGSTTPYAARMGDFDPLASEWDHVTYHACDGRGSDRLLAENSAISVTIEDFEESAMPDRYRASMRIRNTADVDLDGVSVVTVFRDDNGTFQGLVSDRLKRPIPAGKTMAHEVDLRYGSFAPFERLNGASYTGEVLVVPSVSVRVYSC